MAVIDAVPGVEVSIWIDGQPVKEYEDADEEVDGPLAPNAVVKYIEAISDTEFIVKPTVRPAFWAYRQTAYDLAFIVKVDGKRVAGTFWQAAHASHFVPWDFPLEGFYSTDAIGQPTLRPFKFAEVEIVEVTDKTQIDKDVKAAAGLGQITVDVFRVTIGAVVSSIPIVPEQALSEISEKAVKGRALTHGTAFGVAKTASHRPTAKCVYLDGRDGPLACFAFRYRSKEALQQLLIIPRTPSPDPFDVLPAAERERLAREAFRQQQSPKPEPGIKSERTIKRERNNSDIVDLTGDEPTTKQRKMTMQESIDLTDD